MRWGHRVIWAKLGGRAPMTAEWRDAVIRSLITLKALTYAPTGGIVAAATTSLPEQLGGVRNWDYRYCWLRDATFTLQALMYGRVQSEAVAWREWLLRAVAGDPDETADHVRRGAASAGCTECERRLAAGIRRLGAGADRQRGERAVPARRLRRSAWTRCTSRAAGLARREDPSGRCSGR